MINRSMVIAGVIGGLVSLAGYQIVSNTSQPSLAQPSPKTVPLSAPSMKALPQAATAVPQSAGQVQLTFAPIVRRIAPAVVNVYSRTVVRQQVNPLFADPLFQQFFGVSPEMRQRVQQSLGSGVIVRPDGVIITNRHVIEGGQDIVVVLADKREFKARVLLSDARTDLAVLRIDTHGERLPTIQFGDSDRVQVGDLVLAIGDPFGIGQTVTMGIVSALARTQISGSDYQFFIQTDAAINPGNSGGALVTTDGKLAGINTAIVSRTGENAGVGFAIPSNLARGRGAGRRLQGAVDRRERASRDKRCRTGHRFGAAGRSHLEERVSGRPGRERRSAHRGCGVRCRWRGGGRYAKPQLPDRHAQIGRYGTSACPLGGRYTRRGRETGASA
jgi:S1-C subfamily serine protease